MNIDKKLLVTLYSLTIVFTLTHSVIVWFNG